MKKSIATLILEVQSLLVYFQCLFRFIIYNYADEMKTDICPNCNYTYQLSNNYTYCPQCNTKLKNKCDNCNRIIPDEATETCPYCGKEIEFKVGEIPTEIN